TEAPSLHGFVAFMRAAAAEVKRDMDIARNEVRVMTVHGAKGLEAPVVILADTTTRPAGPRDPRILTIARSGAPAGMPHCLVWAGTKDQDVKIMAAAPPAAPPRRQCPLPGLGGPQGPGRENHGSGRRARPVPGRGRVPAGALRGDGAGGRGSDPLRRPWPQREAGRVLVRSRPSGPRA